jgi:hypothetical protein
MILKCILGKKISEHALYSAMFMVVLKPEAVGPFETLVPLQVHTVSQPRRPLWMPSLSSEGETSNTLNKPTQCPFGREGGTYRGVEPVVYVIMYVHSP